MKLKMHLVITDRAEFGKGNYNYCLALRESFIGIRHWTDCGVIELDIDIDKNEMRQAALDDLEQKENEAKAAFHLLIDEIKTARSNLLAITHEDQS